MQVAPLNVVLTKVSTPITVSSAAGGAGQAVSDTTKTIYAAVRNTDSEDCEYRVNSGDWLLLYANSAANLDIDLSVDTVYLRKILNGRNVSVVLDTTSAGASGYRVGDDEVSGSVRADGSILGADGGVRALSEAVSPSIKTASGQVLAGPGEFRGFEVSAFVGAGQVVSFYDALTETGTPFKTFTFSATGYYYRDGDGVTPGNGTGSRRICSTGLYMKITGGTSRTLDVDGVLS